MTVAVVRDKLIREEGKKGKAWRRYPAYKESSVEWLGEVPAHWDTISLKYGYDVCLGKMLQPEPSSPKDSLEPYLRTANVFWTGIDVSDIQEMWFSPREKELYQLQAGDLIVCEGGDVGRSAIWDGQLSECYIQNAVHRVRPKGNDSNRFLYYWLYTLKHAGYIDLVCSRATIAHLTAEKLQRIPVVRPPLDEQRAIAGFLDRETEHIDTLIAKKERLIELLQEKRTALISHAVTKGLDPGVPMQDSGVEWLGEVPAHWDVVRLKFLAESLQTGPFGSQLHSHEYVLEGIPIVNPSHMVNGHIEPDWETSVDEETWERLKRHKLREGDIVFARRGELGRCALVTEAEEGWLCGTGSLRMRPKGDLIYPPFLNWTLSTGGVSEWLTLKSVGTTMDNLNTQILSELRVPVPPLQEQHAITEHINRHTAKINRLIETVRKHNETLREYRTALISAAVAGKIDVRISNPSGG